MKLQSAGGAGLRVDPERSFPLSRSQLSALLTRVAAFAGGAVCATAALSRGLSPFGVAAVAASAYPLYTAAGAFLCFLLDPLGGAVYSAAALLCFACVLVFSQRPQRLKHTLFPLLAGGCLLILRFPLAVQAGPVAVLLLICESILCIGSCLILRQLHIPASPLRTWSRLLLLACGLIALQRALPFSVCSPARCLCVLTLLSVAFCLGSTPAAGIGLLLGAAMDFAGGTAPFFTLVYSVSGLFAGLFCQRPRQQVALLFTASFSAAVLWSYQTGAAAAGFAECAVGGLLFACLPDKLFLPLQKLFSPPPRSVERPTGQRTVAASALQTVSGAVASLGLALEDLRTAEAPPEAPGQIYDCVAASVCRTCASRDRCWQHDYAATRDALGHLTQRLEREGHLVPGDFPQAFSGRCLHLREFTAAVNDQYRGLLRRTAAAAKEAQQRQLMQQQYQGLQGVLRDLAGNLGLSPEYFPALESRARRVAQAYLPGAQATVYSKNGRLHVELLPPGEEVGDTDLGALGRSLGSAFGKTFLPPLRVASRGGTLLRFSQQETFAVKVHTLSVCKSGEVACGDSSRELHTEDGRSLLLLSDGMGTGAGAGVMSGRALDLICGFLRSGCSLAESTQAVLPVLAARFPQWGFVTLDLLEISLFSGDAQLLKYGAAPSFLLRKEEIQCFACSRLPAGLSEEPVAPPQLLHLQDGDRMLLISDGLWESAAVQALLRSGRPLDPETLPDRLMALAAQDGVRDDRTVLLLDFFAPQE